MKARSTRNHNPWVHAAPSPIQGQGLFARTLIPTDTLFVEYAGPRLSVREGKRLAEEGNVFLFRANRREFIDGSVAWNLARFANHSCVPNAQALGASGGIWLRALRDIPKGEEITYDYGYSFRDEPTRCGCGSARCHGRIVAARYR